MEGTQMTGLGMKKEPQARELNEVEATVAEPALLIDWKQSTVLDSGVYLRGSVHWPALEVDRVTALGGLTDHERLGETA